MFDQPLIMQSVDTNGRHWFTTLDFPPMQLLPVAANHCRVGHFLATLIAYKIGTYKSDLPEELILTREDVKAVDELADHYPELEGESGSARVRLCMMEGPLEFADEHELDEDEGNEAEVEQEEDEDDALENFLTPQPPSDYEGDYDSWIVSIARLLGANAPQALGPEGYETEMAAAATEVQRRLPALRDRFLKGMDGLNLGFKTGLPTRNAGMEYVWVSPTAWSEPDSISCKLESEPRNCKGYKYGSQLTLSPADVIDYAIGSEGEGLIDAGLTQRIAADYGKLI